MHHRYRSETHTGTTIRYIGLLLLLFYTPVLKSQIVHSKNDFKELSSSIAKATAGSYRLVRMGSNDSHCTYVPAEKVQKALDHLLAGRIKRTTALLKQLCPVVPELPAFEIV